MGVMQAAELLVEKIKTDYKDDIALVVIMGSYVYGETHSRSDLDLFFVPNTERGYNLGFTFIIDKIGFDFWPISWERLERIANFEERITSIITEGKVIYYSSESDIERFNQIKNKALTTSDKKEFLNKASKRFHEVYKIYWRLLHGHNISDVRKYAIDIIQETAYTIALLNGETIKKGRGKLKQEILNMKLVPEDFSKLYDTVFTDNDIDIIKKGYGQLIKNMELLIAREKNKITEANSIASAFNGFYEEMINSYNKIYHSCEINDAVTALFACVELTSEVEQAQENTGVSSKHLPNLVEIFEYNNLVPLAEAAQDHQIKFVELLTKNGIKIREFNNYTDLASYLYTL